MIEDNAKSIYDQYVAIAKIIIKNHPELKLVDNYKRPYCNIDCDCDKSFSEENCNNCKEQMYENYDVAILEAWDGINYGHEYELIQFHQSEYGTCILTDEDMLMEIEKFNNRLYNRTVNFYQYDLNQYQNIDKLKKYAKEFFGKMISDFILFLNKDILPIEFYLDSIYQEDEEDYESTLGELIPANHHSQQNTIRIYHVENISQSEILEDKKLLQIIRHECIHYALNCSYLKCGDGDGIFRALCDVYDANGYLEMDSEEQSLYDGFMYIYKNADELIRQHDIKESKKMLLHYMLRYIGHIPWDVNPEFLNYAEPLYKKLLSERTNEEKKYAI